MDRVYPRRINWQNLPSTASPINETNLNKIDYAVYEIDGRVVNFDITKADQSDLLQTLKSLTYNPTTGVFVFTYWNGSTLTADLNIEKIPVSFSMSPQGVITMTTSDGTTYTADVASLIKQYTFNDSTEIDFTTTTDASGNKTVTASLKSGSITGDKLQPNYLADCVSAKNQAQNAATNASNSATAADSSSEDAEAWAVGERNGQPVPSTDPAYHNNSKYWSEQAGSARLVSLQDVDINNVQDGDALVYNGASQKWVNGAGMSSEVKTSLDGQFTTVTGGLMQKCEVELEPIQDLHGYSKPWTGGSGKNKLPNNATTQTINGVTWTVEKDADGNVIGVDANGKATAESNYYFYGGQTLNPLGQIANGMILSGCPSGGGSNSYYVVAGSLSSRYATDSGYSDTLSNVLQDGIRVICRIVNGYTANHVKFRPMIRQSGQSADFEPYTNICPISGHTQAQVENCGKNILDYTYPTTTSNGITCTNNGDGTYTLNGTATANATFILKDKASLSAIYEPNKSSEMKLLGCPSGGGNSTYKLQIWRNNGGLADAGSGVTVPSNALASSTDWNLAIVVYSGQVLNNLVFKPMLTKDLSATYATFEPYNGYTIIINLGGTYYGGTLDAVSGVLTVTHEIVDLGTLSWTKNTQSSAIDRYYATLTNGKVGQQTVVANIKCSGFEPVSMATLNSGVADAVAIHHVSGDAWISTTVGKYSDANAFKSAVNGVQLCYELATPQTIQRTPKNLETLVGQNDVFAPLQGQTVEEVEFREVMAFEDVEAYTDSAVNELSKVTNYSKRPSADMSAYFYKNSQLVTFQIASWNFSNATSEVKNVGFNNFIPQGLRPPERLSFYILAKNNNTGEFEFFVMQLGKTTIDNGYIAILNVPANSSYSLVGAWTYITKE